MNVFLVGYPPKKCWFFFLPQKQVAFIIRKFYFQLSFERRWYKCRNVWFKPSWQSTGQQSRCKFNPLFLKWPVSLPYTLTITFGFMCSQCSKSHPTSTCNSNATNRSRISHAKKFRESAKPPTAADSGSNNNTSSSNIRTTNLHLIKTSLPLFPPARW